MTVEEQALPTAAVPAGSSSRSAGERTTEHKLLLVVDRRAVIRGCLALWIGALDQDFEVVGIADITDTAAADLLPRARAVIFSTDNSLPSEDRWLGEQIGWVGVQRRDVPVVLICELHAAMPVEVLARRLHLSGYIPTSSSMELAQAALRVIIAGGRYLPPSWCDGEAGVATMPSIPTPVQSPRPALRLTPREQVVLELLERGLPNKVISDRLGMSPSTVKAHVHNIIAKLNVRNRTEAAVARYAQPAAPMQSIKGGIVDEARSKHI
jgi:DNA-binding NarL/FixJ family response regulator